MKRNRLAFRIRVCQGVYDKSNFKNALAALQNSKKEIINLVLQEFFIFRFCCGPGGKNTLKKFFFSCYLDDNFKFEKLCGQYCNFAGQGNNFRD